MKNLSLLLFLPLLLALCFFVAGNPFSSETVKDVDSINPVIGNESFRVRFGREPNVCDDEDLRIRTHLAYVEALLRSRDVRHLPEGLQTARLRNLNLLREYHLRGEFPRNYDRVDRRPCFIDRDGRICAVGYLVEQTAGRDMAEDIRGLYKYAYISEMEGATIEQWIARSGFTPEEVATIQPTYRTFINRSTIGAIVGCEGAFNANFAPSSLHGSPSAALQSSFGSGVYGGLFYDMTLGPKLWSRRNPLNKFYLHVRPAVAYRTVRFQDQGVAVSGVVGSDTVDGISTQYYGDVGYAQVNVDALLGYYIGERPITSHLQVLVGPSISLGGVFADKRVESLRLSEEGASFVDVPDSEFPGAVGSKQLADGRIDNVPDWRLGVKAGLRYQSLQLGKWLEFVPSIWYTHDLTPIVSGSEWRAHSLQVGLDWVLPVQVL